MIIIIPTFLLLTFLIVYSKSKSIVGSSIKTFLIYTLLTVIFAESLSIFKGYSIVYLFELWTASCFIAVIYIYKYVDYKVVSKTFLRQVKIFTCQHKILVFFCAIIIILATMRAALMPPQNVDSLMYHLSRAFFYYKNEAVANFPSSYGWSNYTGPLNAIFMAQLLIFQSGNDFFHNFIQFIPWILSAFAVYGIALNLGAGKKWALMSAVLSFTLSEAVLSAATTQCDLLMASYCVMSVYLMSEILKNDKHVYKEFVFLGVAGGAAVVAKISAGIVLLPFLVAFVVVYILKTKKVKSVIHMLVAGVSAVIVPLGYWVRTGMDLSGDFLAMNISASMSMIPQEGAVISNILGRAIINVGYLFGSPHIALSSMLDKVIRRLYDAVGATEISSDSFTMLTQWVSHDEQPYFLQMALITIAVVVIIFATFKKKKIGMLAYTALGGISLILVAISISAGITSISRYELGPVMLLIPVVGIAGAFMEGEVNLKEISRGIYYFGMIMAFGVAIVISMEDSRQSPTFRLSGTGYEAFRNRSYFGQGYDIAADEYFQIVEDIGATKIGFMEKEISGYYPALYKFKDKKYTTKSIYGASGTTHIDESFIPDCIVYVGADIKNTIEYKNKIYEIETEARELLFNNAKTALYVLKD